MSSLVEQLKRGGERRAATQRGKDPRRVAAGRKSAATREKKLHEAERDVPDELLDIWERIKWQLPFHPRREIHETFLQWVEENPQIIVAWRLKRQADIDREIKRFSSYCLRVYKSAARDLELQKFSNSSRFKAKTLDKLEDCREKLGPEWDAERVRRAILLERTGAPF